MACKAKNTYYLAIYRKKFAHPYSRFLQHLKIPTSPPFVLLLWLKRVSLDEKVNASSKESGLLGSDRSFNTSRAERIVERIFDEENSQARVKGKDVIMLFFFLTLLFFFN